MLETILKIAGMIVTVASTIVKAIDLIDRFRHQKKQPNRPKVGCFFDICNLN